MSAWPSFVNGMISPAPHVVTGPRKKLAKLQHKLHSLQAIMATSAQYGTLSWPTDGLFLPTSFLFPYPAMKSPGSDDRNQFVDRCSERLAIFQELRTFVRFCMNFTWYTIPQNPVLIFQIEDVSGQQAVGSSRNQCQQRMKKLDHRGKISLDGNTL
jgi:hypothetical protein